MYQFKGNNENHKSKRCKKTCFLAFLAILSAFMLFNNICDAREKAHNFSQDATKHLSQKQINIILLEYKYFFSASIKSAIDEIIRQNPEIGIRKALLRFEMHLIPAFRDMSDQAEPAVALLDVWTLAERMVQHLENEIAKDQFKKFQPILLNAAKRNRDRILEIVKSMVPDDCFTQGCETMRDFAKENPIGDTYSNLILHTPQPKPTKDKSIIDIIFGLPGMIISPGGGIDRKLDDGVSAIREFTLVAGSFDRNVKDLPESIRWQLLSFLYDLEEDQLIQSLNDKMAEISVSHAKLSSTIESMPNQVEILIDQLAIRAAQLIAMAFVLILVYRCLFACFRKKTA
jgi:hypothetical protein